MRIELYEAKISYNSLLFSRSRIKINSHSQVEVYNPVEE